MNRKILLPMVIILATGIALAGLFGYRMYLKYGRGVVPLDGSSEPIPETKETLSVPTRGESDWNCWRGPEMDGKSTLAGIRTDWSGGLEKAWEVGYLCNGEESVSWSGPAIQGNRLVIMGREGSLDRVFCLDPASGELLWVRDYEAATDTKFGAGPRATPFIDSNRVYTYGRAGDLACWNLGDGTMQWKLNVTDAGGRTAPCR